MQQSRNAFVIDPFVYAVRPLPCLQYFDVYYTARQLIGADRLETLPCPFRGYTLYIDSEANLLPQQHYFQFLDSSLLIPSRAVLVAKSVRTPTLLVSDIANQIEYLGLLDPVIAFAHTTILKAESEDHSLFFQQHTASILSVLNKELAPRAPTFSSIHHLLELFADSLLATSHVMNALGPPIAEIMENIRGRQRKSVFVLTGSLGNGVDVYPYSDLDIAWLEKKKLDLKEDPLVSIRETTTKIREKGHWARVNLPAAQTRMDHLGCLNFDFIPARGDIADNDPKLFIPHPTQADSWIQTSCLGDKRDLLALDRSMGNQVLRLIRICKFLNYYHQIGLNSLYLEMFVVETLNSKKIKGTREVDRSTIPAKIRNNIPPEHQEFFNSCFEESVDSPVASYISLPEALIDLLQELVSTNLKPVSPFSLESPSPEKLYACEESYRTIATSRLSDLLSSLQSTLIDDNNPEIMDSLARDFRLIEHLCAPWMLYSTYIRRDQIPDESIKGELACFAETQYENIFEGGDPPKMWRDFIENLDSLAYSGESILLRHALRNWLSIDC